MPRSSHEIYIDPELPSSSTSRLLIWQALKKYRTKPLIALLSDPEIVVRTLVARELQVRGGPVVWKLCRSLCASKNVADRVMGLFILGQLGTPKLPFQRQSFELIHSLLVSDDSPEVIEQALYSIGHLRKGEPIPDARLAQWVKKMKIRRGSPLAEARAFALRK